MVPAFRPGFRFSPLDGAVIASGGLGAVAASRVSLEFAALAVVAVLHFFLFCNVFRISRALELAWSAFFLAGVGARTLGGIPWSVLGPGVLVATGLVVWRETRKPSYHGVLWRRMNPQLPDWWAHQAGAEPGSRSAGGDDSGGGQSDGPTASARRPRA